MSDYPPRRQTPWTQITVVLGFLTVAWGTLLWLTGGLQPQWRNDITDLQKTNTDLQKTDAALASKLNEVAATCANDKVLLVNRIDSTQQLFTSRLDAMWRPSDYAERDSHLNRLDGVYSALRDQVNGQAYDIKDLDKRVTNLSGAPVRNPRN